MDAGSGQGSTSTREPELTLAELDRLEPLAVLAGRNGTKADIRFYRRGQLEIAVKDFRPRSRLLAATLGRWLIGRETRAYRAAGEMPGVPRFLGRLGPSTLAVTRVSGRELARYDEASVAPSLFDELESILARLHGRGVALADLKHRDVLLADDGTVWVVDLAMAWVARGKRRGLARLVFERLRRMDEFAVARLRARYTGSSRTHAVEAADRGAVAWHRRARRLKYVWDRLRGAERLPPVDDHWRFGAAPPADRSYDVRLARTRVLALWAALAALAVFARPRPYDIALGAALVASGEAVRWWAAGHLVKSVELVTSGPYAYVRNPLYLGRLAIFSGLCVMGRLPHGLNWGVWLAGLGLFFGYYLPRKERVEPERLAELHGDAYRRYREQVRALVPRLRPYSPRSEHRWSWQRVRVNREHWMLAGLGAATALLLWRAYSA